MLSVAMLLLVLLVGAVSAQEEAAVQTQRQPLACHLPLLRLRGVLQRECRSNRQAWSYENGTCVAHPYNGCAEVPLFFGRRNQFMNLRDCQESCLCTMPPSPGLCRANMERLYFNTFTKTCDKFVYTGCFGNANNFMTENACLQTCGSRLNGKDQVNRVVNEENSAIIYQ